MFTAGALEVPLQIVSCLELARVCEDTAECSSGHTNDDSEAVTAGKSQCGEMCQHRCGVALNRARREFHLYSDTLEDCLGKRFPGWRRVRVRRQPHLSPVGSKTQHSG